MAESPGEGGNREPILSVYQEGVLLLVVGFGAVTGLIGVEFFPQYYPLPSWLPTALLIFFIVGFVSWAVKGGVPPRAH